MNSEVCIRTVVTFFFFWCVEHVLAVTMVVLTANNSFTLTPYNMHICDKYPNITINYKQADTYVYGSPQILLNTQVNPTFQDMDILMG